MRIERVARRASASTAFPQRASPKNWASKMVLNIVMVGFFAAVSQVLEPDAVRQAVADIRSRALSRTESASVR